MPADLRPTCRCGHDRTHPDVRPKLVHSLRGTFWLMAGASSPPIEVQYVCRTCGQTFDRTRDPQILRRYR